MRKGWDMEPGLSFSQVQQDGVSRNSRDGEFPAPALHGVLGAVPAPGQGGPSCPDYAAANFSGQREFWG